MTKAQAKEVIELLSKDKTEIAKEDVFKIIDMIDDPFITCPTTETPPTKPWWETWTFKGSDQPPIKVTLNTV